MSNSTFRLNGSKLKVRFIYTFSILIFAVVSAYSFNKDYTDWRDTNPLSENNTGIVDYLASFFEAESNDSTSVIEINENCVGPYNPTPALEWGIAKKFETNAVVWNGSAPTAADLDGDGISELIVTAADKSGFYVYSGDGSDKTTATKDYVIAVAQNRTMQVAVADIIPNGTLPNGMGKPEVVAINRFGFVYIFGNEGGSENNYLYKSTTPSQYTTWDANNQRAVTPYIVDIDEDGTAEIVMGSDVFGIVNGELVKRVAGPVLPFFALGGSPLDVAVVDIIPSNPGKELVFGIRVYGIDLEAGTMTVLRDMRNIPGFSNVSISESGPTAVADLDLDGDLDIVFNGTSRIFVWDPNQMQVLFNKTPTYFNGSVRSIPLIANVYDDINTGGKTKDLPEIVIVNSVDMVQGSLTAYNLNYPNANLWTVLTNDMSGNTGVTAFDFDGNGIREIVYRDQTHLRIINGNLNTPMNYVSIPVSSETWGEYPIVGDFDNDGEADIAVTGNNKLQLFNRAPGTFGWKNAPNYWNQRNFRIVNINNDLTVPRTEIFSATTAGINNNLVQLQYNDVPAGSGHPYGYAYLPDAGVTITSVNATCPAVTINAAIQNYGAARIESGFFVSIYDGNPTSTKSNLIGVYQTTESIEGGTSIAVEMNAYLANADSNTLFVVVNDNGTSSRPFSGGEFPSSSSNECNFDNNMASSSFTCLDSDGDGIINMIDIDDDNDGIIDSFESPDCFFFATAWNTADKTEFVKITSDLTTLPANSNFKGLTDNLGLTNAAVQFSTTPAQSQLNKSIFKMTFLRPVQLDAIYIQKTSATQVFGGASSLMVQGSNDETTWTNLLTSAIASPPNATNVTANGGVSLTTSNKFTINANAARYKYYRIYGVAAANILSGIVSEIYFDVNNNTYTEFDFQKLICDADFDGDGIPNHLDSDSDGDGCSDAFEAGATTDTAANYKFTSAVGANGLADILETTVDSGTIKYNSTYLNYSLNSYFATCADTDGDGVLDIDDIDDDNDGILDAVESPNCFLGVNEWNTSDKSIFASISSQLNTLAPNTNFARLTDNIGLTNGAVQFITTSAQSQLNKELFKITLSRPTQLDAIYIQKTTATQIFANVAGSLMLQGSNDDANWTNLLPAAINSPINATNVTANGNVSLTNSNKFTVTANAAPYRYYRIFGVGTTAANILSGIASEFYFDVNSNTYQASYYPKASCLDDIDGDGIANHLDLDSDGDTCSDALEGGSTLSTAPNFKFTGPVGINGLDNSLETAIDNGQINYTLTYYPLAISDNISPCLDSDGDGINNDDDIDDDNDGIIDAVESPNCFLSANEWNTGDKSIFATVSSELSTLSTNSQFSALTDGIGGTVAAVQFVTSPVQNQFNKELFKIELSKPTQLDAIYIKKTSATQIFGLLNASLKVQGFNDGDDVWTDLTAVIASPLDAINVTANGAISLTNSNKFILTNNLGAYQYYRILGVASVNILGGIASEFYFDVNNQTYQASYYPKISCGDDFDGDGIYNHLDLDSDGDGCSDALEAGATTSKNINFQFTGNFGTNGLLNSLETQPNSGKINYVSSYNPFALSSVLSVCADFDGDGINDIDDIDDDNDGILDHVESPFCFYDEVSMGLAGGQRTEILQLTTDLNIASSARPLLNMVDNPAGTTQTFTDFVNAQSVVNKNVLTVEFIRAVKLDELVLEYINTSSIFNSTNTVANATNIQIEGSNDNTSWTALANPKLVGRVAEAGNVNRFPITKNSAKYKFYRLTGTGTTGDTYNLGQIRNISFLFSNYQPSEYPKSECSNDYDEDGFYNHQDLDSDNDGCNDAAEAGVISHLVEVPLSGDFGTNGFLNSLETAPDSGVPTFNYTYGFAVDPKTKICVDTDGDGIPDFYDIDDDNDGILDTDEGLLCLPPGILYVGPDYFKSISYENILAASAGTFDQLKTALTDGDFGTFGANFNWIDQTKPIIVDVMLHFPVDADGYILANDNGVVGDGVKIVNVKLYNQANELLGEQLFNPLRNDQTTLIPDKYAFSQQFKGIKRIVLEYTYTGATTGAAAPNYQVREMGLYKDDAFCTERDTDGDGIPDHLDLDSDGDGCSDAFEAGSTSGPTSLTDYPTGIDSNGNGLLDIYENMNEEGTINYPSSYDLLALNAAYNKCLDSDGDGIIDLIDIDDDNDGVLDHIESPSCFQTANGWNTSNKETLAFITSDLTVKSPLFNSSLLLDNIAGTQATVQFAPVSQAQLGKTLFKVNFLSPVTLSAWYIAKTSATQIFASTASSLMVQGSNDDTTWTNLLTAPIASPADATNITANGAVSVPNSNKFTIAPSLMGKYKYYRIQGVAAAVTLGGIASEFYFDVEDYHPSYFPLPTCGVDTDEDGIPNHLDLDSDGDTCPDAIEAGTAAPGTAAFSGTSFFDNTTTGANGFADALETSPESGVYKGEYTYVFAIYDTVNACLDSDGDGIPDLFDIDDDNDGVLDAVESPDCFLTTTEWNTIDKTFYARISSQLNTLQSDFAGLTDNVGGTVAALQFATSPAQSQIGKELFKIEMMRPTQLDAIYIQKTNATQIFATTAASLMLQGSNDDATWVNLLPAAITSPTNTTNVTANGGLSLTNSNKFTVATNGAPYKYYRIFGVGTTAANILGGIASEFYFDVNTKDYQASYYPKLECTNDLDGDGTPNHLDLDSDGDGCFDAIEAGTAPVGTSPFSATSFFDNTTTGANGFRDVLETNPESGVYKSLYSYEFAIDENIDGCLDTDGDGIPDVIDLDDDNDGVLDILEDLSCENLNIDGKLNWKYWTINKTLTQHDLMPLSGRGGTNAPNLFPIVDAYGLPDFDIAPRSTGLMTTWNAPPNTDLGPIDALRFEGYMHFPASLIGKSVSIRVTPAGGAQAAGAWVISRDTDPKNWIDPTSASGEPLLDMQNTTGLTNPSTGWTGAPVGFVVENNYGGNSATPIPVDRKTPTAWTANVVASPNGHYISFWIGDPLVAWNLFTFQYSTNGTTWTPMPMSAFGSAPPSNCTIMDTDGDGIPNRLDLDSDEDGCPDAIESGTAPLGTQAFSSTSFFDNTTTGANGFRDALETSSESGVYMGVYTYNYAIDATIDYCLDTDGDGIPDLIDIDDDNDGVLDAVESPSCFLTADEWNTTEKSKIVTINSELFLTEANSKLGALTDGIGGTAAAVQFFTTSAQSQIGKELFKIELSRPTQLDAIYIQKTSATQIFATTAGSLMLQGSNDDATWIDLLPAAIPSPPNATNVTANGGLSLTNSNKFTVASNGAPYKYYRIFGVGTTAANVLAGIASEFYFDVNTASYQASYFPKATCSEDADGDGIPNHLDLDSDGDGCPDAIEAGTAPAGTITFNATSFFDPSSTGANGFYDDLETNLESGIYKGVYSYQYAIDEDLDGCLDTDGDGVPDVIDLDDDNDGVLDTEESTCVASLMPKTGVKVTSPATWTYGSSNTSLSGLVDGIDALIFAARTGDTFTNAPILEFSLPKPTILTQIEVSSYPNQGFLEVGGTFKMQGWDGTQWGDIGITQTIASTNPIYASNNSIKFDMVHNRTAFTKYRIFGVAAKGTTHWAHEVYFLQQNCNTDIDTDGDGIPNRLDLDSDGDGCADAIEANASKTAKSITVYPTGTDVNKNGLNDNYESTTLAGTVNYETSYIDYALNASINACTDTDGDGIADIFDLDDDNDGILDSEEMDVCGTLTAPIAATSSPIFGTSNAGLTIDGSGLTGTGLDALATVPQTLTDSWFMINPRTNGFLEYTLPANTSVGGVVLWAPDANNYGGGDGPIKDFTVSIIYNNVITYTSPVYTTAQPTKESDLPGAQVFYLPKTFEGVQKIKINILNGWYDVDNNSTIQVSTSSVTAVEFQYNMTLSEFRVICAPTDRDTDGDGIPDRLDLDSDDDGCSDANEAYGSSSTEGTDGNMYYGAGNPPAVNADGTVIGASYTGDYTPAITVGTASTITTQPTDQSITGTEATFSAEITAGSGTISYQWQLSSDGGVNWVNVTDGATYAGATTATLNLSGITSNMNEYRYRLQITQSDLVCGNLSSSAARLILANNPVVVDDNIVSPEDTPVTGNVLSNDTGSGSPSSALTVQSFTIAGLLDSNGDPIVFTSGTTATIPGVGTITIAANGDFTFTPELDYNGTVPAISYTATDANGGSGTGTLGITITPVNDAPVVVNETISTPQDTPILGSLLTNVSDVDGDDLVISTFNINGVSYNAGETASIPGVGTIIVNADGTYTFTPALGYVGPVPPLAYTVSDGNGGNATGTLTLSVSEVNDAPLAANDVFSSPQTQKINGDVLANDSDPDNDPIAVSSFTIAGVTGTFTPGTTATIPGVGTLVINADGTFEFIPLSTFTGIVPDVTYTVSDGSLSSTAKLQIVIIPVLQTFITANEQYTIDEDTSLSCTNAVSFLARPATFVSSDKPADPWGNNMSQLIDGEGATGVASDGAGPFPYFYWKRSDNPVTFFIDMKAPSDINEIKFYSSWGVNEGVKDLVVRLYNGSTLLGTEYITLPMGYFTPQIEDLSKTYIDVTKVELVVLNAYGEGSGGVEDLDRSSLVEVVFGYSENCNLLSNEIRNASLEQSIVLSITQISFTVEGTIYTYPAGTTNTIPGIGTIRVNSNGTYNFTPFKDWFGIVPTITYTITDGEGNLKTADLDITVVGVNDDPIAVNDDNIVTPEDTPVTGNVLTNDSDPEGALDGVVSFTINGVLTQVDPVNGGTYVIDGIGTLIMAKNGVFTFTPAENYNGPVPPITYTIKDTEGATDSALLNISITPVNDAPVAENDTFSTNDQTPATGNVLANDSDVEGDTLAVVSFTVGGVTYPAGSIVTIPDVGTIVMNADGTFTFNPVGGNETDLVINYTISDGKGGTATATLTIEIEALDTDGDGVPDYLEILNGTSPTDACDYDVENQNLNNVSADWLALDCDGDGESNATELENETDPQDVCSYTAAPTIASPNYAIWAAADCDGDGVTNGQEILDGTDPLDGCKYNATYQVATNVSTTWAAQDCDGDGLTNAEELALGTNPLNADTDGDGNPDNTDPNPATPTAANDVFAADPTATTGNTFDILANDDYLPGTDISIEPATGADAGTAQGTVSFVPATGQMTYTPTAAEIAAGSVTIGYTVCNGTVCATAMVTIVYCDINNLDADCDGDGVSNGQEILDGTDPLNGCEYNATNQVAANVSDAWAAQDCDNDGLTNSQELSLGTNPLNPDSDGDGLTDGQEVTLGTNPLNADSDGDGVPDGQEVADGTSPLDLCDYTAASQTGTTSTAWNDADCDGDGESNATELANNTDPQDPCSFTAIPATTSSAYATWAALDCDGDGVSNGQEILNGTDPLDGCDYKATNQEAANVSTAWAAQDCDGDGLTNAEELALGTDPLNADTDGDGNPDGTDPNPAVPTANDDTYFASPSATNSTFNVLANDDYLPGSAITLERATGADAGNAQGTLGFDATTGELTYTPTADEIASGSVTIGYTVCNGTVCNTAMVTIVYCDINDPNADCDGDGVTNGQEILDGTDPLNGCEYNATNQVVANVSTIWAGQDCDNDGLTNSQELTLGTNPLNADTDGDGLPDGQEVTLGTNPLNVDSDGDGVPDGQEVADGTSPLDLCDYTAANQTGTTSTAWNDADCDGDGESNATELANNTDPQDPCSFTAIPATTSSAYATWAALDCDGDGVTNGQEILDGTDPLDGCKYNATYQVATNVSTTWGAQDCDGDGLTNAEELALGTNPLNADTDGDGVPDGQDICPLIVGEEPTGCPAGMVVDFNVTDINVPVTGDLSTNDVVPAGTTYGTPIADTDNPAGATITVNADGTYVFNATEPGVYTYMVPVCGPGQTTDCPMSPLQITVLDPLADDDAPVVNPDIATVKEDSPVVIDVLANDASGNVGTDLNPASLTITEQPKNGTVSINADGTVTYTPDAGFTGTDVFTYTVCDTSDPAICQTGTVTVTVLPEDMPEVTTAGDDFAVVQANADGTATASGNVLANDSSTDPDAKLTASLVTDPETLPGALIFNEDGTYTFTPQAGFAGPIEIVYTVCDDATPASCATATLHILVEPAPITPIDFNVTNINVPVNGDVSTNDVVPAGTTYGTPIEDEDNPDGGTITMNPDGSYTFLATEPGVYNYMIPVCAPGETEDCPLAPLQITVLDPLAEDNLPVVNPDIATAKEDSPVVIDVLANDASGNVGTDLNPASLTITEEPENGTVTINADGTVTYTPDAGFTGTDTFTYTVCDTSNPANCQTGTVTVTVVPTDMPEVTTAGDDFAVVQANADGTATVSGNVLSNDKSTDPAAILTASLVTGPTAAEGILVFNADGTYTFTPAAGFAGALEVIYTVCDDATPASCSTATLHILVEPAPQIPVDFNVTDINVPVTGDLSTNDVVPAGTTYGTPIADTDNPAGATITVNADGTYEFNATEPGVYTYMVPVCGPGQTEDCPMSPLQITVLDPMANDNAPVVNPDIATAKEDSPVVIDVLANDASGNVGTDLNPASLTITEQPENGIVTINTDGTVTYTPDAGFTGTDTFTYTVCDTSDPAICQTGTVTVTVVPTDMPEVTTAGDDFAVVQANADGTATASGNVLANDSSTDPDAKLTASLVTDPATLPGTLVFNPDGTYTFTPDAGFAGPVEVVYTVCDDATPASCATATLHILVEPAPQIPVDFNVTDINVPVTGDLSTNDVVPAGTTYGTPIADTANPAGATITVNADGTYVFNATLPGVYTYMVPVCGPGQTTDCPMSPLQITVLDPMANDNAPVVNPDIATAKEDSPVVIDVLANDASGNVGTDLNPASLTITEQPKNGTVSINADGTVTYTPEAGFTGTDVFTYTVCDTSDPAICQTGTVTVTVVPTDMPEVTTAGDDFAVVQANADGTATASGNVLANDSSTDPDAKLTASLVTDPATLQGTLVFNPDGTYTFTPDAGFAGPVEVVYTVCDDATPASCATATLHILVEPAPIANPDFNVAYIDRPIKGDVSTNDVVPAGTTYGTPKESTDNRPGATLTMNPDGTYTFEAVVAGVYTYLVPVCGADGKCVETLLSITVHDPFISDQAPIVNTDLGVTREGDPVRVSTLGNDSSGRPGVALNPASVNVTKQPKNGTVSVDPVTGDIIYTPNPGFVGVDSYSYTVCDTGDPALCSTAVQQITVVAKDTPNVLVAADDFVRSPSAEKATGNVLDNDADLKAGQLTVTAQQVESEEGVFTMNADGTFEFVPAPGFIGPISFVYTVCDNGTPQACATATLYILITPNDLVANMDNFQDNEINGLLGGVAGNVLDNDKLNGNLVESSDVSISIKDNGGMSGVTIDKDGNLIVPKGTASGTYVITYTICDVLDPTNCDEAIAIVEVFHGVNLKITKLAEAEEWFEGDEFEFTLTVENNGQTEATAVEVIDLLPEGLRYVTSTVEGATAETKVNGQQITWTVASLPSGSSFQIKILVKAAPLEGGRARTLVNTASVGSLERELTESDNSSSAAVNIKAFFIPNTITPNGDRINDTFEIPGLGRYVSNELLIFNRWGDHVYERKNYQNDWSAEGLVSGTYFYLLKVTDESGKDQEFKGFIQVVKERIR